LSVAISVHMKRGLFGPDPFVILVGTEKTVLIRVDRKRYESIVAPYRQATYLDRLSGTMHAFAEYADTMAKEPLDEVISRNPGSMTVDNGDIVSFECYVGLDERSGRRHDYYSFELKCRHRKFRGSVDRGTDVSGKAQALREVLGDRFRMR
jgi:hypothetical protein